MELATRRQIDWEIFEGAMEAGIESRRGEPQKLGYIPIRVSANQAQGQ
jgi:hypothetical protein